MTRTRVEVVAFLTEQLQARHPNAIPDRQATLRKTYGDEYVSLRKQPMGYGKVELRHLLDFLYGGPPANTDEEL